MNNEVTWYDSLFDSVTGTFESWLQYDTLKEYGNFLGQQNQINPYSPYPTGSGYTGPIAPGQSLGGNSNQLITIGLLGAGAILLLKLVK